MALVNCRKCGKEINGEAKRCPHCGTRRMKKAGLIAWLITGLIFLYFALNIIMNSSREDSSTTTNTQTKPMFATDAATQAKRKAQIQDLMNHNVVYKIEMPGTLPHVYVGRNWYILAVDDKEAVAGVVYAYYATINPHANIVVLKDMHSGKRIGTFSQIGLSLN